MVSSGRWCFFCPFWSSSCRVRWGTSARVVASHSRRSVGAGSKRGKGETGLGSTKPRPQYSCCVSTTTRNRHAHTHMPTIAMRCVRRRSLAARCDISWHFDMAWRYAKALVHKHCWHPPTCIERGAGLGKEGNEGRPEAMLVLPICYLCVTRLGTWAESVHDTAKRPRRSS